MKRKMFRRLMAASLATVMVAGMVGCGSNPGSSENPSDSAPSASTPSESTPSESTPSGDDSSEENVEKYTALKDENGNVYDLGGMEITLYTWFDETPSGAYGEAQQEWREWVQSTYNFKFVWDSSHNWGGTSDDFTNYVSTNGDDNNYIFCMCQRADLTAMMNQGLMYDLSTLDCLDFSDQKYVRNFDIFTELNKNGQTILIVTHDVALSKKVKRVVAIRDGKISSERVLKEAYADRLQESSIDWRQEDTQDEYVILDRAGRLQIPAEFLQSLQLRDNKVSIGLHDGKIVISNPES